MAEKIESYQGSYPLAYYEIGTVYSFYGHPTVAGKYATEDQIRRYSGVLRDLEQKEERQAIKPVKGGTASSSNARMRRYYAVVVNKISGSSPKIEVMFIVKVDGHNEYGIKSYAVSHRTTTDGRDLMAVSTSVDGSNLHGKRASGRVGGITLDKGGKKKGGITLDAGQWTTGKGIGGITLDEQQSSSSARTRHTAPSPKASSSVTYSRPKKVGGITLDED